MYVAHLVTGGEPVWVSVRTVPVHEHLNGIQRQQCSRTTLEAFRVSRRVHSLVDDGNFTSKTATLASWRCPWPAAAQAVYLVHFEVPTTATGLSTVPAVPL